MTRHKNNEPDIGHLALFEWEEPPESNLPPKLLEPFTIKPISVLDARKGYWQARKRAWKSLGIRSELGRGENLDYRNQNKEYKANEHAGSSGALHTGMGEAYGRKEQTGTSIFDPVLCEVAYRWFSPKGGRVLDPFAGGSVRGIVAAKLGRSYIGIDLSPYQVEANREQADKICKGDPYRPVWRVGDSKDIPEICEDDDPFDFVFTCPPYYDLEVYSKEERDISNAGTYEDFTKTYQQIIYEACKRLKDDRFAAIVVGDIRDKKTGAILPFWEDTVSGFRNAGLGLLNMAVLATVAGTAPVRAAKQFNASLKLVRTHQWLLIFIKGDPERATLELR